MKFNERYLKKVDLVSNLISLHKKRITPDDVYTEGKKLGLDNATSLRAWNNFVQTGGEIDLRFKNQDEKSKPQFAVRKSRATKKNKNISTEDAGKIIKAWMTERSRNIDTFCFDSGISVNQFYSWLRELNVSGSLLGRTILDLKKYAKLDVKIAIWLTKNNNSQKREIKKLSPLQRRAYYRLAQVLGDYL